MCLVNKKASQKYEKTQYNNTSSKFQWEYFESASFFESQQIQSYEKSIASFCLRKFDFLNLTKARYIFSHLPLSIMEETSVRK